MSDSGTAHPITVTINGENYERTVLARTLLVHFIRDVLGLKGTHIGCDTGNCGACTVMYDGRTIKSCMMLAAQADGAEILTVEGLAENGELGRHTARLPRAPRPAVRLLHPRAPDVDHRAPAGTTRSPPRRRSAAESAATSVAAPVT